MWTIERRDNYVDNRKTGQLGGQQKDGTTMWTTERRDNYVDNRKTRQLYGQ